MIRAVVIVLVVLLVILQYSLWFGDGGWHDMRWLAGKVATQRIENQTLEQRNRALAAEVEDLKQGNQAIEGRARAELGLIKPDEVFYQVVGPAPASTIDGPREAQPEDLELPSERGGLRE